MFEIEKAIAEWRIELRRNPAPKNGQAAELEACLRDEIEELVARGTDPATVFRQAVAAMGPAADAGGEFFKAKRTRRSARPSWQPPRFVPGLIWNYIQVALRRVREAGLALLFRRRDCVERTVTADLLCIDPVARHEVAFVDAGTAETMRGAELARLKAAFPRLPDQCWCSTRGFARLQPSLSWEGGLIGKRRYRTASTFARSRAGWTNVRGSSRRPFSE
jgi:hypothetical protein